MPEPNKELLRYGEVQDWLEEEGITRRQARTLIEMGIIKGAPLRGREKNGRDYYQKSQIKRAVLTKEEE